ncbi:MD-2-related lipid-recognition protein-like [Drosophila subpulchrella]|uniref:MD-2-related lipid-recognition protein-like n=1 Tax=Drosophila subpulchrella TaxID=1486046 RepID=UPI0018A1AFF3|nr:MD-2-related lipid-recognition protein-like [Drosophila subpulchrella]
MLRLSSLLTVGFFLVLASVSGEIVNFETCDDSVDTCTIHQVNVDPCPEAKNNAACHIHRRRRFTMSFDFTPHFDADTLDASLGWAKSENVELPLLSMDREACKYTNCPVRSGVKQTYTNNMLADGRFPLSPYTIRWALKDPVSQKRCCFTIDIKVVR